MHTLSSMYFHRFDLHKSGVAVSVHSFPLIIILLFGKSVNILVFLVLSLGGVLGAVPYILLKYS